jgi:hypothetical protein
VARCRRICQGLQTECDGHHRRNAQQDQQQVLDGAEEKKD